MSRFAVLCVALFAALAIAYGQDSTSTETPTNSSSDTGTSSTTSSSNSGTSTSTTSSDSRTSTATNSSDSGTSTTTSSSGSGTSTVKPMSSKDQCRKALGLKDNAEVMAVEVGKCELKCFALGKMMKVLKINEGSPCKISFFIGHLDGTCKNGMCSMLR